VSSSTHLASPFFPGTSLVCDTADRRNVLIIKETRVYKMWSDWPPFGVEFTHWVKATKRSL
jgi:hypothetical protein